MVQMFGSKILTAGCLNSSAKFTFGLGKLARSARRSKQSGGKRRSCLSSNNSFPPSYPEKSRSIKARETEEKKNWLNFKQRYNSWNNGKEQKI